MGVVGCSSQSSFSSYMVNHLSISESNDHLEVLIKDFYKLKSIGIKPYEPYTSQELRTINILESTTRRLSDGRYEVGLLALSSSNT